MKKEKNVIDGKTIVAREASEKFRIFSTIWAVKMGNFERFSSLGGRRHQPDNKSPRQTDRKNDRWIDRCKGG